MAALLKKEFSLCQHPTGALFVLFSAFVFIPNYPYEVMFFFSGLSVFFICLTARENGDAAFTCCLPVGRKEAVLARMSMCALLQAAMWTAAGIFTAIKELALAPEAQLNMAGSTANLAFLGYCALLAGVFNLIFFPLYYRNPQKVGVPFLLAGAAQFLLIALLTAFRFTVPLFRDVLNLPDPANMGAKACAFVVCVLFYAGATALSVHISQKRFPRVDL